MATNKLTKIAIVHDWLTNLGGAERVVWSMLKVFPEADLYTSVYNSDALAQFQSYKPIASFLQNWPLAKSKHQLFAQARQLAFESFDFSRYQVVITSSTAEAKGIITSTETKHISYIHTPTRYYWSHYNDYIAQPGFGVFNPLARFYFAHHIDKLRHWDFAAAQRADMVLANSKTVQKRIETYYKRDSTVLYPPVDTARFKKYMSVTGDYFLIVSRLIPYKRIDVVVDAFNKNGLRLHIVGNGSELTKLKKLASQNIKFFTGLSDLQVTKQIVGCQAFIFPTEEDFGITPVEAMAAGKPVIAYGRGGATESVIDGTTGVFFTEQSSNSLNEALKKFQSVIFDSELIKSQAEKFSEQRFIKGLSEIVSKVLV